MRAMVSPKRNTYGKGYRASERRAVTSDERSDNRQTIGSHTTKII